jgi:hypothetical protein
MAIDTCLRGLPALFPRRERWHDRHVTEAVGLSATSLGLWEVGSSLWINSCQAICVPC